jgi:hypothetical protein
MPANLVVQWSDAGQGELSLGLSSNQSYEGSRRRQTKAEEQLSGD